MNKTDIYESVTNSIIEALEDGSNGEWSLPWHEFSDMPQNVQTGKSYRGVNVPMLWLYQQKHGYKSGLWATYKQWKDLGAQVRKGEKGSQIVFWKSYEVEAQEDHGEAETRMFARWSVVFNVDQVDGYELVPENEKGDVQIIETANHFIKATGADIRHGESRAFYNRIGDFINVPALDIYKDTGTSTATENYYSTLLHELTHWSGAPNRLDRTKGKKFGDQEYAFEELVAELGSAMLCSSLNVSPAPRLDHAHYIKNWLKALKSDKRFIFKAASQAQKAVDYLYGLQPE